LSFHREPRRRLNAGGPLTVGPDGNLWFGDGEAGIGRITPNA
jgi:streptogramin lyase